MLWFIGLALAGVLGVTWWVGSYPARIVVINEGKQLAFGIGNGAIAGEGDALLPLDEVLDGEFVFALESLPDGEQTAKLRTDGNA